MPIGWRMPRQHCKDSFACRFGKWRERRSRVEKDFRRTDRAQAFFRKKSNVRQLQNVLLSYAMYNFDLGYVQACCKIIPHFAESAAQMKAVMRAQTS